MTKLGKPESPTNTFEKVAARDWPGESESSSRVGGTRLCEIFHKYGLPDSEALG